MVLHRTLCRATLLGVTFLLLTHSHDASAFQLSFTLSKPFPQQSFGVLSTLVSGSRNDDDGSASSHHHSGDGRARKGDPVRAATGRRPSVHPVTINAIAELLKARAKNSISNKSDQDAQSPLQIALAAGQIAAEAIGKRQESSQDDEMTLEPEEAQTIAGRVVGVAVRLDALEEQLYEKCSRTSWVSKYGEWASFGVLQNERSKEKVSISKIILDDPLFVMNRAECLLAIFIHHVEAPELELKNATVAGGSNVDFIDSDRREVLLG